MVFVTLVFVMKEITGIKLHLQRYTVACPNRISLIDASELAAKGENAAGVDADTVCNPAKQGPILSRAAF